MIFEWFVLQKMYQLKEIETAILAGIFLMLGSGFIICYCADLSPERDKRTLIFGLFSLTLWLAFYLPFNDYFVKSDII